jgi:predicted Fe-Mo cluster-binding NifX family protein
MKICVPSMGKEGLDAVLGQHFGKVPYYTIVDSESGETEVVDNTSEHMGGVGLPPELMSKAGVDVMLCGGLGRKAVNLFEQFGIEVYAGAQGTVGEAIEAWKNGQLRKASAETACQGQDHDQGH